MRLEIQIERLRKIDFLNLFTIEEVYKDCFKFKDYNLGKCKYYKMLFSYKVYIGKNRVQSLENYKDFKNLLKNLYYNLEISLIHLIKELEKEEYIYGMEDSYNLDYLIENIKKYLLMKELENKLPLKEIKNKVKKI